jgi:hypothetical protein
VGTRAALRVRVKVGNSSILGSPLWRVQQQPLWCISMGGKPPGSAGICCANAPAPRLGLTPRADARGPGLRGRLTPRTPAGVRLNKYLPATREGGALQTRRRGCDPFFWCQRQQKNAGSKGDSP